MSCTSPTRELITFWLAGSLSPDEAAQVAQHVVSCDDCREAAREGRVLMAGLQVLHLRPDEIVAAAAGDLQSPHLLACSRCRDEVTLLRDINADLSMTTDHAGQSRTWLVGLAAAAVVVIAVPLLWRVLQPAPPLAPPVATIAVAQPSAPPLRRLSVEKASLAALANEALVLRGTASPRRALLDDLAIALEPYRRDDLEEAATRLRTLREKYPDAPEIPYYHGVCLLLLGRPGEAVAALQEASPRMADASYYLAIARVNAAQTPAESDAALAGVTALCNGRSDVAARACAALTPSPAGRLP